MPWDRYAVVDVETTGFSSVADRIVEVARALVPEAPNHENQTLRANATVSAS